MEREDFNTGFNTFVCLETKCKFHLFPSVHEINKRSYVLTHIFPVLYFFPSYPSAADSLPVTGMYFSNFWWCACSRWHLCSTLSLSPSPALPAPRFSCQFLLPSSTQWYWHLSRLHLFILIFQNYLCITDTLPHDIKLTAFFYKLCTYSVFSFILFNRFVSF